MDMSHNNTTGNRHEHDSHSHSHDCDHHVGEAASDLLKESKKMAHNLYNNGVDKVCNMQNSIKGYSHEVAHHVHDRPMRSLLIAGVVGFILASLMHK